MIATIATATQAAAAVGPVLQAGTNLVSADALPTVQIDGVVWQQAIVGNTVYAGGSFGHARPAGAAPGTNQVARANLLAYDINTGSLVSSFAPTLNGQVRAVSTSPMAPACMSGVTSPQSTESRSRESPRSARTAGS